MTRADFIRTMRARPDDAAAKLVYADWLEESGEDELDALTAECLRFTVVGTLIDSEQKRAKIRLLHSMWRSVGIGTDSLQKTHWYCRDYSAMPFDLIEQFVYGKESESMQILDKALCRWPVQSVMYYARVNPKTSDELITIAQKHSDVGFRMVPPINFRETSNGRTLDRSVVTPLSSGFNYQLPDWYICASDRGGDFTLQVYRDQNGRITATPPDASSPIYGFGRSSDFQTGPSQDV